jgi:hypothetical protein
VSGDSNSTRGVALGFIDGDASIDAVFANAGQQNRVCLGDGSGNFSCSDVSSHQVGDVAVALGDGAGGFSCSAVSGDANSTRSVALGQLSSADVARFLVAKNFSDDNTAEVEVTLSCNTGLPLEQTTAISKGDPVNFVVGDFEQGTLDCEVTEVVPAGYSAFYLTGDEGSEESCSWTDLQVGQYVCRIENSLDEVEVEVTKVWIDENPQFNPGNVAEAD